MHSDVITVIKITLIMILNERYFPSFFSNLHACLIVLCLHVSTWTFSYLLRLRIMNLFRSSPPFQFITIHCHYQENLYTSSVHKLEDLEIV